MAASITKFRLLLTLRNGPCCLQNELRNSAKILCRLSSSKAIIPPDEDALPHDRRIDFDAESLAARGYLRNQKPYTPPKDVEHTVFQLCKKHLGNSTTFSDATTKYHVLTECSSSLNHAVPNSLIHKITSIDELVTFYKTPINMTVPLDMMKDMDLPKNLHVTYKYHRFHPETDTMFGGKTVFTNDSTLVTSIKYKKKYPSFINDNVPWPEK